MKTTNRAGAPDTSKKGRKSGIETLEAALAKEQVSRMTKDLRYDDIQRFSSVGASVSSKAKPVRDEEGKIDIIATFEKAGIDIEDKTVDQAAMIKGGLF